MDVSTTSSTDGTSPLSAPLGGTARRLPTESTGLVVPLAGNAG
ncbi:hypothetical protein [Streptomyces sp. NBC_01408]|nr:hypothetical protein [Streptomyces sp. NBC_01408]MCX4695890.1 hypothetical protein [Streptomyces sp. NBC_01408]